MPLLTNYILEDVDIYCKPVPDILDNDVRTDVTLGDLHGNAIKLLFMLIKHGIATDISDKDYCEMVDIYQKRNPWENDLERFNTILSAMSFHNHTGIRLIGDIFADRGMNDYYTLKILQKLRQAQVPIETLFSNHCLEFIFAYERALNEDMPVDFAKTYILPPQTVSAGNLQKFIDYGLVSEQAVIELVNFAYKPILKVISYAFEPSTEEIILFSHAPIDLFIIERMAEQLGVDYQDETAECLANTIDAMNASFHRHVTENTLSKICPASYFSIADNQIGYLELKKQRETVENQLYQAIGQYIEAEKVDKTDSAQAKSAMEILKNEAMDFDEKIDRLKAICTKKEYEADVALYKVLGDDLVSFNIAKIVADFEQLHQLIQAEVTAEPAFHKNPFNALYMTAWNRSYSILNREPTHHGYAIRYVHGHDKEGKTIGNIYNLDNLLGKGPGFHGGEYSVLKTSPSNVVSPALDEVSLLDGINVNSLSGLKAIFYLERNHFDLEQIALALMGCEDKQRLFIFLLEYISTYSDIAICPELQELVLARADDYAAAYLALKNCQAKTNQQVSICENLFAHIVNEDGGFFATLLANYHDKIFALIDTILLQARRDETLTEWQVQLEKSLYDIRFICYQHGYSQKDIGHAQLEDKHLLDLIRQLKLAAFRIKHRYGQTQHIADVGLTIFENKQFMRNLMANKAYCDLFASVDKGYNTIFDIVKTEQQLFDGVDKNSEDFSCLDWLTLEKNLHHVGMTKHDFLPNAQEAYETKLSAIIKQLEVDMQALVKLGQSASLSQPAQAILLDLSQAFEQLKLTKDIETFVQTFTNHHDQLHHYFKDSRLEAGLKRLASILKFLTGGYIDWQIGKEKTQLKQASNNLYGQFFQPQASAHDDQTRPEPKMDSSEFGIRFW